LDAQQTQLKNKIVTKILNSADIVKAGPDVNPTPYKYNGGYNYKAGGTARKSAPDYTIVVDYLSLTLTGYLFHSSKEAPEKLSFGEVELSRLDGGTRHYTYRYKVKLRGEDFGLLMTTPRAGGALSMNRPDYNEFKLENHVLYRQDWTLDVCKAIQSIGLQFYHVTRLDIALDGYNWLDVFERYQRKEIRPLGRASMTTHTSKGGSGFHALDGVDWGKRSSEKHLTVYKVGKRVEVENKGYRAKFWAANGLENTEDIQRLELKLKAKALKRLKTQAGEQITEIRSLLRELESTSFLAGIMKAHFKGWFQWVVPKENQKNTSRLERVDVIDWEGLAALEIERVPSTKKPNEVWAAKRCSSALLKYSEEGFISDCLSASLRELGVDVPASSLSLSGISRKIAYAVAHQHGVGCWLQRRDAFAPA